MGTPLVEQRVWPALPDGKCVLTRQKRGEGNDLFAPPLIHFGVSSVRSPLHLKARMQVCCLREQVLHKRLCEWILL